VRGYVRNGLGPRVYVTDSVLPVQASATGGNSLLVVNAELRFATPLFPDRMRVALFVDAGQVWERGGTSDVSGVRVTPGMGLRFTTPLGPIRVDAAYNGYAPEPGPLYYLNHADNSLTQTGTIYAPGRPASFWQRVVVQFAVGQAF